MRRRLVLLIAADPHDVQLTRQTLAQVGAYHTLRVVGDGEDALTYLRQEGASTDPRRAPLPDVIVLDLPLPRLSGQEVIQRLKQDPQLKRLPLIVLASSGEAEDIRQAYAAGANAYLQKPLERRCFMDLLTQIEQFWLETVELPLTR